MILTQGLPLAPGYLNRSQLPVCNSSGSHAYGESLSLGKIRMTPPNLVAAISTAPISSLIEASESLVVATLDMTARPLVNLARTEPDSMDSPSSGRPSWSRDSRTANLATSALARPCTSMLPVCSKTRVAVGLERSIMTLSPILLHPVGSWQPLGLEVLWHGT